MSAGEGRRGEFAFKIGRASSATFMATTPPTSVPEGRLAELYDEGRIDYHPVFPGKPGYASRRIENEDDVRDVIAMIRLNYDRVVERYGLPEDAGDEPAGDEPTPAGRTG